MQWEKPEFDEISLACEISSYANAELWFPCGAEQNTGAPAPER